MLENVVTRDLPGVYDVNLTLLYYTSNSVRVPSHHHESSRKSGLLEVNRAVDFVNEESQLGLESEKFRDSPLNRKRLSDSLNFYETPADLIIPISSVGDEGFWFRIESTSGVKSKGIQIPLNTRKAVLEVYVSFHGNDEFWYSNPPDSYIITNNLTMGRAHGAYREVLVTIDGSYIGSVIPFPVIFTGGVNPLFWEPVVAIGAFNLPSYDFDLTPFLSFLLDRKVHSIGLGVADGISFWLVDANLHLWLDHGSSTVEAKTVYSHAPKLSVGRKSRFELLDGLFNIKAKRNSQFSGWVKSSAGNFTTHVLNRFKYKNLIRFGQNGTYKSVKQIVKTISEVRIESEMGSLISRARVKRNYPLGMITSTISGSQTDVYLMITNVSHSLRERLIFGDTSSSLYNSQDSRGWMVVKDHNVLSGSATTDQSYSSKGEFGCYSRTVSATDGQLIRDNTTFSCPSLI